jgi:hypothetical protein
VSLLTIRCHSSTPEPLPANGSGSGAQNGIGGVLGPQVFSRMINTESCEQVFLALGFGAVMMSAAARPTRICLVGCGYPEW